MKKIFTISSVMLAAASLSAQSLDVTRANVRAINAPAKAKIEREAPVKFVKSAVAAPFAAAVENGTPNPAPSSMDQGAHYTPFNMLKTGIFYSEDNEAWGYSYNIPYLFGQAYWGGYTANVGSQWTIGTADADGSDCIDEEGNFSNATAQIGVGGFYTPKIWSANGRYSYFYGYDDPDGAPEYSVFFGGTGEEMELCNYTTYCDMNMYVGYTNTAAYGSREFDTEDGLHIQADMVSVDFGYQKGLVVNKLRLPLGNTQFVEQEPIAEGKEVQVYLSVVAENGEETVYHAVMTADNVYLSENWYLADVVFTEEDEDGFSAEIAPVCNGEVTITMTGFMQEGVHCEIPMIYYNTTDYETCSYFDQWVDGVQDVLEDGTPALYGTKNTDAMISVVGYYNFIGAYGTGETVIDGTVAATSAEGYSWAVSVVDPETGAGYNDFDLESTFNIEEWELEYDEDVIAGFDVDTTYFTSNGVVMLYIAVKDLPAGVEGRIASVDVISAGTATCTINIAQGNATSLVGLKGEAVEPKQVYNLQGILVDNKKLAPGFYISNGQKMVVK